MHKAEIFIPMPVTGSIRILAAFEALLGMLSWLAGQIRDSRHDRQRARGDARTIRSLTERELRDIGLSRDDLACLLADEWEGWR